MNKYLIEAYKEALKAYKKNEIPVGAVIVKNNKIIAKGRNNRQKKYNLLGHAEINCILKAEKKQKDWRLDGCTLYVTLEPCEMCNLLIKEARIENVVFLLKKDGNINEKYKREEISRLYHEKFKNFFCKLRK